MYSFSSLETMFCTTNYKWCSYYGKYFSILNSGKGRVKTLNTALIGCKVKA